MESVDGPWTTNLRLYKKLLSDPKASEKQILERFWLSSFWSWSGDPMRPSLPSAELQGENPFELYIKEKVKFREGKKTVEKTVATGDILYKDNHSLKYMLVVDRVEYRSCLRLYMYRLKDKKVTGAEVSYGLVETAEILNLIKSRHEEYIDLGLYDWKIIESKRKRLRSILDSKERSNQNMKLNEGSWAGYENFGIDGVNEIFDGDGSLYWNID